MTNRSAGYRICALVVLLASFYAWDWMPLRVVLRDVIAWSVRVSGYTSTSFVYDGSPALGAEGKVHHYTPECTYLALVMVVAPFLWVFGASRRSNILRLGIAMLVILGCNLVRCWAAVYLDVLGVERFYAHDLPNYAICSGTILIVVIAAIRRDFLTREERVSDRG